MKQWTLIVAIVGLTVIGITSLLTNHDDLIIKAVIGAICTIGGYAVARRNGNGKS